MKHRPFTFHLSKGLSVLCTSYARAKGAVHTIGIPLKSSVRTCKRLGIDFAEAVIGFEFGKQRAVLYLKTRICLPRRLGIHVGATMPQMKRIKFISQLSCSSLSSYGAT